MLNIKLFRASVQNRYSKIDQENLERKISEWKTDKDKFYYRPCKKVDTAQVNSYPSSDNNEDEIPHVQFNQPQSEMFMLCHQTEWQRKLLSRYGQELCFLDATYKTTQYALPLFFIVVKTNVGYTVVGSFVIQQETKASIKEALQHFKAWNQDWVPEFFMTDYSEAEIGAIEDTFPG